MGKYVKGKQLTTVDEVINSDFVLFGDVATKLYYKDHILDWHIRSIVSALEDGVLWEAVLVDEKPEKKDTVFVVVDIKEHLVKRVVVEVPAQTDKDNLFMLAEQAVETYCDEGVINLTLDDYYDRNCTAKSVVEDVEEAKDYGEVHDATDLPF